MKIIQERIGNNIKVTLEGTNGLLNYVVVAQQAANTAVAAKDDAEAAELAAINAQNAAEAAEQGAQTAEQNAVNAEDQAKEWAENPEDAPVSPGEFSALHYAAKADDQRQLAETAKTAAEQAEADAVTAKNAAQTAKTNAETAESGAVTAKNAAQTAKNNAETAEAGSVSAKNDAETARDKAEEWSENPVDVPVENGQFSAKHYAIKSADNVSANVIDVITNTLATRNYLDADAGMYIRNTLNTASSINVVNDSNVNAPKLKSVVTVWQAGDGTVTVTADAGVTLNGGTKTFAKNTALQIIKVAANEYDIIGGI